MDTTREPRADEAPPPASAIWGVIVAYHSEPDKVGTRLAVDVDAPLAICRGRGLFDDRTMSRRACSGRWWPRTASSRGRR
jgi:hypothetical protein